MENKMAELKCLYDKAIADLVKDSLVIKGLKDENKRLKRDNYVCSHLNDMLLPEIARLEALIS